MLYLQYLTSKTTLYNMATTTSKKKGQAAKSKEPGPPSPSKKTPESKARGVLRHAEDLGEDVSEKLYEILKEKMESKGKRKAPDKVGEDQVQGRVREQVVEGAAPPQPPAVGKEGPNEKNPEGEGDGSEGGEKERDEDAEEEIQSYDIRAGNKIKSDALKRTQAMHTLKTAFFGKVPKFQDESGEVPNEFIRHMNRQRKEALEVYPDNNLVDKVALGAAREAMPATSRAAAWFERWEDSELDPTWETFAEAFKNEFMSPERMMIFIKKFQERKQKTNESPTQYLKALTDLQKFAGKSETELLVQFKTGLNDEIVKQLAPFRYVKIQEQLNAAEAVWEQQQKDTTTVGKGAAAMMAGNSKGQRTNKKSGLRCFNCEGFGHMQKDCPSGERKKEEKGKIERDSA